MATGTTLDWLNEIESRHAADAEPSLVQRTMTVTLDAWDVELATHTGITRALERRANAGAAQFGAAITVTLAEIAVSHAYGTRWQMDRVGSIDHRGRILLPRPIRANADTVMVLIADDPDASIVALTGSTTDWTILGWARVGDVRRGLIAADVVETGWRVPVAHLHAASTLLDPLRS